MPLTEEETRELESRARAIRKRIVNVAYSAGGGHVGGSLSQTDVVTALYFKYLDIDPANPDKPDRDRFILSKGHAGLGWASALGEAGYFDTALLDDFNKTGSAFGMHLDSLKVPGVDASTGSLGHGLALGVGMAKAAKLKGESWNTYVMLGDGELCEGSNWEAMMLATFHKLDNLIGFVDRNRLMIDGPTEEITSLDPLNEKFIAFGWECIEIDGHDMQAIGDAIEQAQAVKDKPTMIICETIKGKGVEQFEGVAKWHYGGIDSDMRDQAMADIDKHSTDKV